MLASGAKDDCGGVVGGRMAAMERMRGVVRDLPARSGWWSWRIPASFRTACQRQSRYSDERDSVLDHMV